MSDLSTHFGRMTFLPPGARDFLYRRLIGAGGLLLVAIGLAYFLSLMSFHRTDPSLNNATDSAIHNLMGRPGAIVSDLALQSLGLAGFVPAIVLAAWGWRIMRRTAPGTCAVTWNVTRPAMPGSPLLTRKQGPTRSAPGPGGCRPT